MQDHAKRHGRLARGLAVLALALGAFPATAGAACPVLPASKVFASLGDTSDYFLAPGGDFEGPSTTWTGGSLAPGNDPFYFAGASHTQSLAITSGATATSPVFCADDSHPDFRFVARSSSLLSMLEVNLRFRDRFGVTQTWLVGKVTMTTSWRLTPRIRLMRDLALMMPASGAPDAQLLFSAQGGDWAIDAVFIDPYRR